VYYRLISTPAGVGLFTGVLMSLATGFRFWWSEDNVVIALVAATIAGVGFGVLGGFASRQRLEPFAGLTSTERVTVMRAVQKGLAITDRRLAPAVVVYADSLRQQMARLDTFMHSALFRVAVGFNVLLAIASALLREWGSVAIFTVIVLCVAISPWSLRSRRDRFERAEQSAQALLDRG
jgi:hypothetical protein